MISLHHFNIATVVYGTDFRPIIWITFKLRDVFRRTITAGVHLADILAQYNNDKVLIFR